MDLLSKIKTAPTHPGCYLFKNDLNRVIYIGKAKNLRNRVAWYFKKENQAGKTAKLVSQIVGVEFIVTDTEVEALLLEAELIRKHQPKYNIQLKSGVRYAYVRITKEKFPRLETARVIKKTDQVFGPYVSGQSRQQAIRLANSLFKLRVCRHLPKRACLLYHIKQCGAPCINNISETDYNQNVAKAALLLKGKTKELIEYLAAEMKAYADHRQYELAKVRRDQILALKNISERQKVFLKRRYNQDVINFSKTGHKFTVQLFNINKGVISGRKEFNFTLSVLGKDNESLSDFIRQYYYTQDIPQEIIVPEALPEKSLLEKYLEKIAGHKVKILAPQKGDKLKLLALVKKNIEVGLKAGDRGLSELQEKLALPFLPRTIECFDISNLGPTDVVGSMVHFNDGRPDKNNYRRFKIKTFLGQSDYEGIKEIVYRRYYGLIKEKGRFPDLIVVDGGKPQLSAALAALRSLGLQLPVIGLAKREEEIYANSSRYPLRLPKKSPALKLLQRIRDEAHRFAITYQKVLRGKRTFK